MAKEQLIIVARDLLIDLGIKSVTMDDIARKAGVSKKTLYNHFKDKTDLIRTVVLYVSSKLNEQAKALMSSEQNPIEQLYETERFFSCQPVIVNNSPQKQLQKYYPKIYKEMQNKQLEEVGGLILQNLKTGIELGMYRKDINLDFTMRLYLHVMIESGNNLLFFTDYDKKTISGTYLEYHIRAIATPKGVAILEEILKKD
ncbi:TetR family transcriptional regulator [Capnocytophaga stomatis]|uniref:TetR family transcriptional regulator n=1 Tax=Capnocytophaga stomatis TaxID=1848904 RepID=A0A250FW90_9FLAO|nr:TetR/AcrR family transcriptional regulator [Capnocytophaga stomatis]ATA89334.1 TetR family transcriptional regulator [Capnocytophaga stomatis]GIJ93621.1 TetR family transcriptional regulator [Capnocytophaga stomatis]GIJ96916.1 TetR family transcriptional regulator [Capnocytophaga stomatis]